MGWCRTLQCSFDVTLLMTKVEAVVHLDLVGVDDLAA
jgi:hypothetical protein